MNRLWSGMLLLGIAYGAFCGKLPEVTDGALRASKEAVVLAISLLGVTGLWSGLMEIARKAGMIDSLVKKMGPVMRFLFPKVPSDHPAIQSAATNMICNVFGLGAAATPPGLLAMEQFEELEEERRLCYVAITRAKQHLVITYARQRMLYGRTTTNLPSRFVDELPAESVKRIGAPKPSYQQTEPRQYGSFGRVSIYGDSYNDFSQIPTRPKPQKDYSVHTAPKPAPKVSFAAGEMVQHKAFGRGMILTVLPMGNDALLEIAFDGVGTKRLMANTAAQHMKKL